VAEDAASAVRTGLFQAEGAVERARQAFIDVSPIGSAALEQATVQRSDLEAVLSLAKDRDDALGRAIEQLGGRPFGEALATISDRVPEWAARDGKRVELVVEGREVRVPRALADVLPSVLTHLVRNAIAHGIEPPPARAERDKGPVGTIWASIDADVVTVEDDGGGIDDAAVAHRARALGFDETKDATLLIFEKGLSTRATSDALAGRGVGLDAVRAYLADVAYEVDVVTAPGQGTKFVLRPR
jgi:chemotaxis protein histidine kinase CheA